jgi:hypothetical protein
VNTPSGDKQDPSRSLSENGIRPKLSSPPFIKRKEFVNVVKTIADDRSFETDCGAILYKILLASKEGCAKCKMPIGVPVNIIKT